MVSNLQADGGAKPNKNNDDLGLSSVLFPFGFGLSSSFKYSPPTVANGTIGANDTLVVHVTVLNAATSLAPLSFKSTPAPHPDSRSVLRETSVGWWDTPFLR